MAWLRLPGVVACVVAGSVDGCAEPGGMKALHGVGSSGGGFCPGGMNALTERPTLEGAPMSRLSLQACGTFSNLTPPFLYRREPASHAPVATNATSQD